jgi:hypothetical protein
MLPDEETGSVQVLSMTQNPFWLHTSVTPADIMHACTMNQTSVRLVLFQASSFSTASQLGQISREIDRKTGSAQLVSVSGKP